MGVMGENDASMWRTQKMQPIVGCSFLPLEEKYLVQFYQAAFNLLLACFFDFFFFFPSNPWKDG